MNVSDAYVALLGGIGEAKENLSFHHSRQELTRIAFYSQVHSAMRPLERFLAEEDIEGFPDKELMAAYRNALRTGYTALQNAQYPADIQKVIDVLKSLLIILPEKRT